MRGRRVPHVQPRQSQWLAVVLALAGAALFFLLTPARHSHFDYTFRVADALLHGHIGLRKPPPSWLNEFVPWQGHYYSVFPLGAVLVHVPVAVFSRIGWLTQFPAPIEAAALAGGCIFFFAKLAEAGGLTRSRQVYLALFPVFATWTWCNLGFAGAWQIALGFALLGEAGALYFTLVKPRPIFAGLLFAIAVGNRTEIILTAPIFAWWLLRGETLLTEKSEPLTFRLTRPQLRRLLEFGSPCVLLLLFTAWYNFARFGSPLDFGYFHIPQVAHEPWFQHGLFSVHAIPWNMNKMLLEGMRDLPRAPFFSPPPFGCSIFLSSPMLFLLFRPAGRFARPCWIAIGLLTLALWCHGNPGGWQFSYRYAMVLLPWMFLLIKENGPARATPSEVALFACSVVINAVAVYEFLWTQQIRP